MYVCIPQRRWMCMCIYQWSIWVRACTHIYIYTYIYIYISSAHTPIQQHRCMCMYVSVYLRQTAALGLQGMQFAVYRYGHHEWRPQKARYCGTCRSNGFRDSGLELCVFRQACGSGHPGHKVSCCYKVQEIAGSWNRCKLLFLHS